LFLKLSFQIEPDRLHVLLVHVAQFVVHWPWKVMVVGVRSHLSQQT